MKRISFVSRDRDPILNELSQDFTTICEICECSIDEHEPECPHRYEDDRSPEPRLSKPDHVEVASEALVQDETEYMKAIVFIEDAVEYRSIHHKVDEQSLKLYRFYYSKPIQWVLYIDIFVIHILAFFEVPSSLTRTSDVIRRGPRNDPACGITETVEIICLQILLIDVLIKGYLFGKKQFIQNKWLIGYASIIAVSMIDWIVTVSYICKEVVRMRRLFRPFFLIQNSSVMKKTVNCIKRILPEISSVLLLLFLHLYFFTMFGMLLFPNLLNSPSNNTTNGSADGNDSMEETGAEVEGQDYFKTLDVSIINLLILLTTANNPDVMIPAYVQHRLYSIYFILFSLIGLYCFMNILTAVVYNQFRGYFLNSMQSSFFRRRVGIQAAFEVLKQMNNNLHPSNKSEELPANLIKMLIDGAKISTNMKQRMHLRLEKQAMQSFTNKEFQNFFDILDQEEKQQEPKIIGAKHWISNYLQIIVTHRFFNGFCHCVTFVNIISITVELIIEYDRALNSKHALLSTLNMVFIIFYVVEQSLKIWAYGRKAYFHYIGHIFDGLVTICLVVIEFFYLLAYGAPFDEREANTSLQSAVSIWNLVRIINMLIILKILRIIPQIKIMSIVASTVLDIVRNLRAFGGILVVIFYVFAILGMEIFQDKLKFRPLAINGSNSSSPIYACGTFQQLNYWPENFDDFFATIKLLWDLMYVNNWHVFVNAYVDSVQSRWAWLYFILWFLVSVIICLNLFTALILENFIMKWDRAQKQEIQRKASYVGWKMDTIQDLFRTMVKEPSELEIQVELRTHEFISF